MHKLIIGKEDNETHYLLFERLLTYGEILEISKEIKNYKLKHSCYSHSSISKHIIFYLKNKNYKFTEHKTTVLLFFDE